MVVPDERLVLESSVIDDFSETLDELAAELERIDRKAANTIEDITADVDITKAMGEIETLEQRLDRVGDVAVDSDADIFQGDLPLNDREAMGVADLFNPKSAFRQTPGLDDTTGASTDGATGDGGSGATGFITDTDVLRDIEAAFGDAFDREAFIREGGEVQRPIELLSGDFADRVDINSAMEQIFSGELDAEVLSDAIGLDAEDSLNAFEKLRQRDLVGLPTDVFDEFRELELSMNDFFRALAALLPLLFVFIGAMPAAIAGLGALAAAAIAAAGALGAVGGVALLGMALTQSGGIRFGEIERRFQELLNTFIESIAPVARQLEPLMEHTFDAAGAALRSIGQRARFLLTVTEQYRSTITALAETVPAVLEDIARFGSVALPVVTAVLARLGQIDVLGILAEILAQTISPLLVLTELVLDLLPIIYKLSLGFLSVATAVLSLVTFIFRLIDAVPFLTRAFGVLAAMIAVAFTATSLYNIISLSSENIIYRVVAAIYSKISALIVEKTALDATTNSLVVTSLATLGLAAAAAVLVGIITFGLVPVLATVSTGFSGVSEKIRSATDELRAFGAASNRVSGTTIGVNGPRSQRSDSTVGYTQPQMTVVAANQQAGTAVANRLRFDAPTTQTTRNNATARIHSTDG